MRHSIRSLRPRVLLRIEQLEDRSNPSARFSDLVATSDYAADRLVVSFDVGGSGADQLARLSALPGAESVTSLGFGIYRVDLQPGADVTAAASEYATLPGVQSAEPDRVVKLDQTLNDPSLSSQYALTTTGTTTAWDKTTGTKGTIVAVIDTGVDYTHPDLAANIWTNPGEIPGNGIDDDGDGYVDDVHGYDFANNDGDPMDDGTHGTHVAGIIGAVGNNGIGVSGVDPNTRIMALKFIKADGEGYTSDAVRALNYAVAHGARVANASWGGDGYDATLATALARARDAGLIFVAAAGNDSQNNDAKPFYPGGYITGLDNIVTVAATDANDNLASFSSYGAASVTLGSPGVNILSTLPGGRYGNLSGTSMATPFVTGAIALLWDAHPDWTYQQIIDKLKASVDPVAALAGKTITGGRLDVAKMLDATAPVSPPVVPIVPPPVSPPPAARDTTGAKVLAAVFSGSTADTFNTVRVTFNKKINAGSFTTADVTLSGPAGAIRATAVTPVAGTNNTQFDITFDARSAAGTYTILIGVDVFDIPGNRLNQNGNSVNGEAGDRFTGTGTLAAADTSSASGGSLPRAIGDLQTVEIPIVIDQTGSIAGVTLTVFIEHANVGDLTLQLRAPDGTVVTLVERRGSNGSGFRDTTFDDAARTLISKAKSPFTGSYRPEQPLSDFRGMNASGTWTMIVTDGKAGNTGTVTSVKLAVTTTSLAPAISTPNADVTKPTVPMATTPKTILAANVVVRSVTPVPVLVSSPTVPTPTVTATPPALRVETLLLLGDGDSVRPATMKEVETPDLGPPHKAISWRSQADQLLTRLAAFDLGS
ncbi:S8 family serine peptidase [Limnoglobus roseus]|uniref:Peptidase S8 n=1 Tax=Limnoglobus roseus TaxID=2598579 RepID=A0A5C1ABY4_9BACT|nr:S8 family serine peptidase [Limnoglobus roseus]QEL16879.1 peptidase S8 [Limnoglobus roseus]